MFFDTIPPFKAQQTLSSDTVSEVIECSEAITAAFHLRWSGTGEGTFTVRQSGLRSPRADNDEDWVGVAIDFSSQPAGAAGAAYIEFNTGARWLQLEYTATSGEVTIEESAGGLKG